jgi:cob(I)alamin adenosyltransferase
VKGFLHSTIVGLSVLLAGAGARAQVPPPVVPAPETAEISACLCLQQAVAVRSAEMKQKNQALDAITHQLADLDAQLAQARANLNINNPDAVARYKALLERRDDAYRQSIGPVHDDAAQATARYNARVNEYNARCANRPFNSALVAEMQAHLSCPPMQ